MAKFVRTTGGLLQLEEKQVTKADYDRVMRFAATLLDRGDMQDGQPADTPASRAGRAAPQGLPRSRPVQVTATPKRKLMDLQAVPPDVFLHK